MADGYIKASRRLNLWNREMEIKQKNENVQLRRARFKSDCAFAQSDFIQVLPIRFTGVKFTKNKWENE